MPNIPGIDTFKGQACHTHARPKEGVDFTGKRVGIIGTGATAVQTIQEIAKTVGHLTVFQRTPNWCAPLPSICNRVRIDHTCFGRNGGFWPMSLPLFQGARRGVEGIACA
jgi:cation diffusion facilitator CzcD-associated flavoprotein CzcO